MPVRRSILCLFLAAAAIAALAGSLSCERSESLDAIDELYLSASTPAAGSAAALAAVRDLGASPDPRVDNLLAKLAVQHADSKVVIEAIHQLQQRGASDSAPALSILLASGRPIEVRQAVAEAFTSLGCPNACLEATLRYLEEIWQGDHNVEQDRLESIATRGDVPQEISDGVLSSMRKQQQHVYQMLYGVLKQHSAQTAAILADSYGIGGGSPARFALHLIAYLQLEQACPALLQTNSLTNGPGLASALEQARCLP